MKRYRKSGVSGGLFSAIEHQQAVEKKTTDIMKLRDLIDWERFRPLLEDVTGYGKRDRRKGGKPPFDPVLMFKVLILQKFRGSAMIGMKIVASKRLWRFISYAYLPQLLPASQNQALSHRL